VSDPAAKPRLLAFGGLVAMASALGIGRFIYTPILPPMAEGLLLTKGEAGLIASANFLGYLVGALAAASPRLPGSPRGWLLATLAASAVTTGAMGWGGSLELFLGLRFVGGAASAFVLVFASALVLERLAAMGRSNLAAVHFAGVGAGIALSAVLTWALAATDGGWRAMWFCGGLVSLAAVVGVALLVPAAQDAHVSKAAAAKADRSPRIWPLVVAYGLFGFGYVITATFIVAIVRGAPEIRSIEPVVWLVVGLAAIPSVGAWAAIGRRTGVLRAFAIACLVEAAGVAASVVWVSVPGLFVAAVFLGGTFMGITALGLIAARGLSAGDPRRVLGLMTAAFGLGQIIGPVVAGYGFDLTGSFFLPSMLAAAGLCVAAALTALMRRE
jgi:predicted MFS family arabinose efflux permease